MNIHAKSAAAMALALLAGMGCTKPHEESLAKNTGGFVGVYVLEDYARNLQRSRSLIKASPNLRAADPLLEVAANYWFGGNYGGVIEGLKPTAAPNVFGFVPGKNTEYPGDAYPNPNDTVEILQGTPESVMQLKWRDKTYRSIGSTLPAQEAFTRWTNEVILAGEYTGPGGRKYVFSGAGEARWPDRTFAYFIKSGLAHSHVPDCDFIRVNDKREYIGFRWEKEGLLIFQPVPVTSENGHPPLVQPGDEKPFKCAAKPFLVLTPVK